MNLGKLPPGHRKQLEAALEPIPELGYDAAKTEGDLALADRWIFSRLASVTSETGDALENYRFHEAAHKNYHFFWHEFCDWYLEWVKPEIVKASDGERISPSWVNLLRVFRCIAPPAPSLDAVHHRGVVARASAHSGARLPGSESAGNGSAACRGQGF